MSRIDHSLESVPRASGVLLHPTSLPGPYGIGTLGPEADEFLDFLLAAGQRIWQVLPTGPTGYGDSPYQCFSAFAGNPLLVSLRVLIESGLLEAEDLGDTDELNSVDPSRVDFRTLIPWRRKALKAAYDRFRAKAKPSQTRSLEEFRKQQGFWLEDYALFMALKEYHDGVAWPQWSPQYRDRDSTALDSFRREHAGRIDFNIFMQWLFHVQWKSLRARAASRGILLVGDIPIFAALDSVDVWANRSLFQLDDDGNPTVVAGVPPDYFSATGQLWGNPIYRWENHEKSGFSWWQSVLVNRFALFDYVRVDHFRGFRAYWAVPAGETTARNGEWVRAPGDRLFATLERRLGRLPIIAEDLGVITPDVVELINRFGFPGMKIIQFAFDLKEENNHMPHDYHQNLVVYTGTHDNDTVVGWLGATSPEQRALALSYLASDGKAVHWDFIRCALASVARFAVTPMQDILGLGSEARMNVPGTVGGHWQWRMTEPADSGVTANRLRALAELYGRCGAPVRHSGLPLG